MGENPGEYKPAGRGRQLNVGRTPGGGLEGTEQTFYTGIIERMFSEEPDMGDLPERQQLILQVIEDAVREQGYPPTVREIGSAVGLCSPASVQSHLAALEAQGYIRRGASKRRALEIVRPRKGGAIGGVNRRPWPVPLVGRVAAGTPLLAEENIEESLDVPGFLGGDDGCFALRVTGSSMINAGIFHGDIVVVKRQDTAEDGEIVVALLADEATLKRFYREEDQVRLQPENDLMEPIFTRDPLIAGKVIAVMRKL
jgi:repressor LexA